MIGSLLVFKNNAGQTQTGNQPPVLIWYVHNVYSRSSKSEHIFFLLHLEEAGTIAAKYVFFCVNYTSETCECSPSIRLAYTTNMS